MRQLRRKYFNVNLRQRAFNARLLIFSFIMICPTHSYMLLERMDTSTSRHLTLASGETVNIFSLYGGTHSRVQNGFHQTRCYLFTPLYHCGTYHCLPRIPEYSKIQDYTSHKNISVLLSTIKTTFQSEEYIAELKDRM